MAELNAAFWEVPMDSVYLESFPAERAMWFETEQDRLRRYALQEFFQSVLPAVTAMIDSHLTPRQREILNLYYLEGKTQEDIAETLELAQSTVTRHLFGTVRNGKKVGGAIPKLQRLVAKCGSATINQALECLETRFAEAPQPD